MTEHVEQVSTGTEGAGRSKGSSVLAAGGVIGAVGASSCCIVPFVVFSMGLGGAWMGNLIALAPYQPYFIAFAIACLGAGFYFVYRKPKVACDDTCAQSGSRAGTKVMLWSAAVLLTASIAYPYVAPWLIEI